MILTMTVEFVIDVSDKINPDAVKRFTLQLPDGYKGLKIGLSDDPYEQIGGAEVLSHETTKVEVCEEPAEPTREFCTKCQTVHDPLVLCKIVPTVGELADDPLPDREREPDSSLQDVMDDVHVCGRCHEVHDLAMPCPPRDDPFPSDDIADADDDDFEEGQKDA